MASRYHPLYEGVWYEAPGAPFEEIGFYVYLWGNPRQRPCGFYRANDAQLAADTSIPLERVETYLKDLHERGAISRDGLWIFVKNYFAKQPKQRNILNSVKSDLKDCSSQIVKRDFIKLYPRFSQRSANGRATVAQRSAKGRATIKQPLANHPSDRAEQSRAEQNRTEQPPPNLPPRTSKDVLHDRAGRNLSTHFQNLSQRHGPEAVGNLIGEIQGKLTPP